MPREYQCKTICIYDHIKIMTAIQLVKEGNSVYNISKSSGTPYGTLYRRIHDQSCSDRFIIHVKDYEKLVLLLCDGRSSHLTYSTVRKNQDNHILLLCLAPNTSKAL